MIDDLLPAEREALANVGDHRRLALVIAQGASAHDAVAAAEATRHRVRALTANDAASGALALRPDASLALVELGELPDATTHRLIDQIEAQAHDAATPAIYAFPLAALDWVSARIDAPFSTLLCAPTQADRIAAIGLSAAVRSQPLRFASEVGSTTEAVRLQALADEVARIARALTALSEGDAGARETVSDGMIGYRAMPVVPRPEPEAIRAEDVRIMLRLRRQREGLFPAALFADPAWDMMLDLMAARIERLRVAVSSLCIAAAVPPTTALRWIRTLTEIGIFVRVADPTDGRRVFIELSDAAAKLVLNFLGDAKRAGLGVV